MSTDPCATLRPLLSLAEAQAWVVTAAAAPTAAEEVALADAPGRVLARAFPAPASLPRFDQAAMDGYAVASASLGARQSLPLVGRIAAGDTTPSGLDPDGAVRIFTGAPMPPGFDRVIMQEHCWDDGEYVDIRTLPESGANIRRAGEDVATGEALIAAGTLLDPRHIALAAALGVARLPVFPRLRVAVLSTGNELVEPGAPAEAEQSFDSNGALLAALLAAPRFKVEALGPVADDVAAISAALTDAAHTHDLIITTGGLSVGAEDHVGAAVVDAGGRFEKAEVAIKPGKPLGRGRIGAAEVLAFGGNPLATLVGAIVCGRRLFDTMTGLQPRPLPRAPAVALFALNRQSGRTDYIPVAVKGRNDDGQPLLTLAGPGGSARLKPLLSADGLAEIPAATASVGPGDPVTFLPFADLFPL